MPKSVLKRVILLFIFIPLSSCQSKNSNNISVDNNSYIINFELLQENASNNNEEMNKFIIFLHSFLDNKAVTVDASEVIHLETFTFAIKALLDKKRYLFRSAASLINSFADISYGSNKFNDFFNNSFNSVSSSGWRSTIISPSI